MCQEVTKSPIWFGTKSWGGRMSSLFKALVQGDSKSLRPNFFEIGQKKVLLRDPLNRFVSPKRIRRPTKNLSKKVFFRSQKNLVSNFHQLFFGKES